MEDLEGILSFDFEGGLDAAGPTSAAVATAPIPSDNLSAAPASAANNNNNNPAHPPAADDAIHSKRRNYRQVVCRHWLRSLCMKGDACGFLHQYDKSRMPVCRFFSLHGECREKDCVYKHTNVDIKECNMYKLGFCPNGPSCRFKHVKLPAPPPPVEDVLQNIQQFTSYNHGKSNKNFQQRGTGFSRKNGRSQFSQGPNTISQGAVRKPLVSQSANIQQQQQQGPQSQQPVGPPQIQNFSNGMPNQGNKTATPLPQGIYSGFGPYGQGFLVILWVLHLA